MKNITNKEKKNAAVTIALFVLGLISIFLIKNAVLGVLLIVCALYWSTIWDAIKFFKNISSMTPKEIQEGLILYISVAVSAIGIIIIPFGHLALGIILAAIGALVPTVYYVVSERHYL